MRVARLVLGPLSATSAPLTLGSVPRLRQGGCSRLARCDFSRGAARERAPHGLGFALDRARRARYEVDYLADELEGKTYYEPSGNGEERDP